MFDYRPTSPTAAVAASLMAIILSAGVNALFIAQAPIA